LLSSQLVGIWLVTVLLSVLGMAAIVRGFVVTNNDRQKKDKVWLTLGGIVNLSIFLLAIFFSGTLNVRWPIDKAVAATDPNKFELVKRNKPQERTPLEDGESADALTEAIRQGDALVRLESVQVGPISGKGATSYLLIHFRLVNLGHNQTISFEGFGSHQPVLKKDSSVYPFIEARPRIKAVRGPAAFEEPNGKTLNLAMSERADSLLVFELPPLQSSLILEVPAEAWGRTGVCKLRIDKLFDSIVTEKK